MPAIGPRRPVYLYSDFGFQVGAVKAELALCIKPMLCCQWLPTELYPERIKGPF